MYWRCTKRSRCEDPRLSMYREGCTGRSNGPLLNPANVSYELDVPEMYREHKNHLSTFWSLCQAPSTTLAPQVITEVGQAYQAPKLDHGTPTNEPMSTKIDGQHLSGYVPGGVPGYIYIYILSCRKKLPGSFFPVFEIHSLAAKNCEKLPVFYSFFEPFFFQFFTNVSSKIIINHLTSLEIV